MSLAPHNNRISLPLSLHCLVKTIVVFFCSKQWCAKQNFSAKILWRCSCIQQSDSKWMDALFYYFFIYLYIFHFMWNHINSHFQHTVGKHFELKHENSVWNRVSSISKIFVFKLIFICKTDFFSSVLISINIFRLSVCVYLIIKICCLLCCLINRMNFHIFFPLFSSTDMASVP